MKPYTYVIGWSNKNKYYYGCRYAKKSDPSDLWVSYFTSSIQVKKMRAQLGEPDVRRVHKIFDNVEECVLFEKRMLQRLVRNPSFINRNVAGAIIGGNSTPRTEKQKNTARELMKKMSGGIWYTDGTRMKRFTNIMDIPEGWKRGFPDGYKHKIANTLRKSVQGKVWFNNGVQRRKYTENTAPQGWQRGWHLKIINTSTELNG